MFGFVFGTACLIALVATLKGARYHRRRGWGGPYSSAGYGHFGWDRSSRDRWMLRWLFRRLDTSAGQEKVFLNEWDSVRMHAEKARDEMRTAQRELADLMRGASLDESAFEAMFARQEAVMDSLRKATAASLSRVHEALDERQRRLLADLIENPWGGYGRHHHCGRHAHAC